MNEDQRKWLLDLQSKGVKFERYSETLDQWIVAYQSFNLGQEDYRVPAQSVPDIPDWRELCREMQSKGIEFESIGWSKSCWFTRKDRAFPNIPWAFDGDIVDYRIPKQPLPEWREEMEEETKPDQKEETQHRELYIQYLEYALNHAKTGEPMKKWQMKSGDGFAC